MFRQAFLFAIFISLTLGTPTPSEPERHKVIVVGAGVSGFTAAATLLEHNVTDVLVLEAADRIGGRTHTVKFEGVTIDKGAEFVHGQGNNSVYQLVKDYDLLKTYTTLIQPEAFMFSNLTGVPFKSTYIYQLVDESYNIFQEEDMKHVKGSVADYFYPRLDALLRSKNVDSRVSEALRHIVPLMELSNTLGDNLSQLGAWGFLDCAPIEGDNLLKWKPESNGYRTLFDVLSKKFPNPSEELPVLNKTLLNKEVTRVEVKEGGVEVTCTDGSTYLADHVIVTVSLGVLKKHAATMFQPTLPAEKTAAIEALGFGCLAKVIMSFSTRWWPNDTNAFLPLWTQQDLQDFKANSKYGSWTSLTTGIVPVMNSDRMLMIWLSGEACRNLDTLTDEQITDGLVELLDKVAGKSFDIPRPESILRSEWASYPYTLGSYSFRSVESDRRNITNSVLAEPILQGDKPVLLFAGEATTHDHASVVNGALDTGRREAHNIINYLNNKK